MNAILWFVIFVDDNDKTMKVEVLPPLTERIAHVIDFKEVERLIDIVKREMLVMAGVLP